MPTYGPEPTVAEVEPTIRAASRTTGSDLIPGFQAEIDQFFAQMADFSEIDLRGALASLAAMSARVSYMRSQIIRNEGRVAKSFRTGQIEPFLDEVDRQFRTWSRLQSVVQMEWDISKGGT